MKKCAIILPYFGKFNSYFPLFLRSCETNTMFDWLIFTDDNTYYNYPSNVTVIPFTLQEVKKLAEIKMEMKVCLEQPYKLCDYKPTYGLLFEDYLNDYEYWGHCDCDLLFGDLNTMLIPILEEGYDKIFAAGHLTLYKNYKANNKRFMTIVPDRYSYIDVFTNSRIYVFDEDFFKDNNKKNINNHEIFIRQKDLRIYDKDISFNVSPLASRFCRAQYSSEKRTFINEPYVPRRYYWDDGKIITAEWNPDEKAVSFNEYIYLHLQMRKMKIVGDVANVREIEILPDRFALGHKLPKTKRDMKLWSIKFDYFVKIKVLFRRIKNKLKE